jgi:putative addiction module killer protein
MEPERKLIAYENYFNDFMGGLDDKTQDKIFYILMQLRTQRFLSAKFVKLIEDGLFELRIEHQGNIYRIFFCFDEGNIVILFNGFQKKSQKIPPNEIKKAMRLKREYYERKRKNEIS